MCKWLNEVAHHPSLLAALELSLERRMDGPPGPSAEQRSAAFFAWLETRAAGSVRQLHLRLAWSKPWGGYTRTSVELHASLQASLAACRRLQRLRIELFGSELVLGDSLPSSLRQLTVDTTYQRYWPTRVELAPELTALTALAELEVVGGGLVLPHEPCFPSSLTALALALRSDPRGGSDREEMLEEVGAAWRAHWSCLQPRDPALLDQCAPRRLAIEHPSHTAAHAAPCVLQFGHLPRLRALRLERVRPLTGPYADFTRLTRLTALDLSSAPLPSLPALSALQTFRWSPRLVSILGVAHHSLPPGPWLAGLRSLAVPAS